MSTVEIGAETAFSAAGGGAVSVSAESQGEGPAPVIAIAAEPDWERLELVRRIGCAVEDGSVLALGAARPREADGHGDEVVSAALINGKGEAVEIGEARLTTEYDEAGEPRRIGIELMPADEEAFPIRGAGRLREPGVFDFSLDGSPGMAVYEIVRGT